MGFNLERNCMDLNDRPTRFMKRIMQVITVQMLIIFEKLLKCEVSACVTPQYLGCPTCNPLIVCLLGSSPLYRFFLLEVHAVAIITAIKHKMPHYI